MIDTFYFVLSKGVKHKIYILILNKLKDIYY